MKQIETKIEWMPGKTSKANVDLCLLANQKHGVLSRSCNIIRGAARIFRESKISDEKSNFFLFCPNIPFCELVSKKIFLSSSDFFPAEI